MTIANGISGKIYLVKHMGGGGVWSCSNTAQEQGMKKARHVTRGGSGMYSE